MNEPLVSVIIPVHNWKKAKVCMERINQQTYRNIEVIPVDFKGFPAEKRNYGYLRSHGDYVLFLDEDEYLSSTAIASCVKKFEEGSDIVGIPISYQHYSDVRSHKGYIEKCLFTLWNHENTSKDLFFRRKVIEKVGLFNPSFPLSDDVDMIHRASQLGYNRERIDSEKGYIFHDETLILTSAFRKTLWARKGYKPLLKQFGLTYDSTSERKRILKCLIVNPSLILGVSLIMMIFFVVRRIP